jgi:plastocyanin/methionine-rich copper-binding protein CopC
VRRDEKGFSGAVPLLIIVVIAVGVAGWFVWQGQNSKNNNKTPNSSVSEPPAIENSQAVNFSDPKKGAHFESSTPAHSSTLAGVPAGVVIDFNFDLASNSTIKIEKDGKDYGVGDTAVDQNKLAMRRQMDQSAPDGVYTVNYNGCWPDRSCHDGHFQFAINRGLLSSYQDQRGVKEASITISQTKFAPVNVRINVGQTLTWVNNDDVEHYINTDSHPAHTHTLGFNSRALAKGATYSFTFKEKGVYPYHCSAHAADMMGSIVVE